MEYRFELVVSGLDEVKVEGLLDLIIAHVEEAGGKVGGGFAPVSEEEGEDEQTDAG